MEMSTHTITRVGIVKNSCNKQVMYSILLLEKELKEASFQVKTCLEHAMDAFLSHFKEEIERLTEEIRSLLSCLCFNVDKLIH